MPTMKLAGGILGLGAAALVAAMLARGSDPRVTGAPAAPVAAAKQESPGPDAPAPPPRWTPEKERLRARSFEAAADSLRGTLVEMKERKEDAATIAMVERKVAEFERAAAQHRQQAAQATTAAR